MSHTSENKTYFGYYLYDVKLLAKITIQIASYMQENESSFLNDSKIQINLLIGNCPVISIKNFDMKRTGDIYKSSKDFVYINIDWRDFPLSSYKDFTWLEIMEFDENIEIDDITILDDFKSLKTIYCRNDLFSEEQEEYLMTTHPELEIIYYEPIN